MICVLNYSLFYPTFTHKMFWIVSLRVKHLLSFSFILPNLNHSIYFVHSFNVFNFITCLLPKSYSTVNFWFHIDCQVISQEMKSKFWAAHYKMCVNSKLQNWWPRQLIFRSLFVSDSSNQGCYHSKLPILCVIHIWSSNPTSPITCGKTLLRPPSTECQRRCPQRLPVNCYCQSVLYCNS